MMTYWSEINDGGADVDKKEMKKSDSKDKYLYGRCYRETRVLNLDETSSETSSETSHESSSESFSSIRTESESSIETLAEEK